LVNGIVFGSWSLDASDWMPENSMFQRDKPPESGINGTIPYTLNKIAVYET
jgi:hypothetical protein